MQPTNDNKNIAIYNKYIQFLNQFHSKGICDLDTIKRNSIIIKDLQNTNIIIQMVHNELYIFLIKCKDDDMINKQC